MEFFSFHIEPWEESYLLEEEPCTSCITFQRNLLSFEAFYSEHFCLNSVGVVGRVSIKFQSMAEQGFGCMGFSAFYASAAKCTDENAVTVFHEAVKAGVSLFNTATFYGALNVDGFGANLRLIRKCLVGIDRSKIQLMVKIGMDTRAPVESTGKSPQIIIARSVVGMRKLLL